MLGEGRCEKRERCVTIVTFLLFEELISLRVSRRTIGKWMDGWMFVEKIIQRSKSSVSSYVEE